MPKRFFLLVWVIFCLLIFPFESQAQGAVLFLSPQTGTFYVGSTFDVLVLLDTKNYTINAVDVILNFSPDTLQVVEPFGKKSILKVWVSPSSYSNIEGKVSFQGGIPETGIKTSSGLLFTITFRAKAPGPARIIFNKESKVLLHDGKGTNILGSTIGAIYNIAIPPPQGPKVFSPTHPDQDKWYNNSDVSLMWEAEGGISGYSYVLTKDPAKIPDNISEGLSNSVFYEGMEDGLWYFNIKAKKGNNWGGVSSFLIRIDKTPPADFSIQCDEKNTVNRRPVISFFTTDAHSGLDHYEVKIIPLTRNEDKDYYKFSEGTSPYQLPVLEEGSYEIIVRAFDRAGNWKDAKIKIEIASVLFSFLGKKGIVIFGTIFPWWLLIFILICILGVIAFLIYRNKKEHKEVKEKVKNGLNTMKEIIDNEAILLTQKIKEGRASREEVLGQLQVIEDLRRKIDEKNINYFK